MLLKTQTSATIRLLITSFTIQHIQVPSFQSKYSFSTQQATDPQVLHFQSLLLKSTDQSLTEAAEILGSLEGRNQQHELQLRELNERISFFPRHLIVLLEKEQKLIENIQLQDEDNERIDRRVQKELQDSKNYGVSRVAKEVLEIADSLKRTVKLSKEISQEGADNPTVNRFCESEKMLFKFFSRYGIQEFDPLSQPYDPNTQETVYEVPCPQGTQINTVAETMRTGFKIRGRLLRSARVGIFT